MPKGSRQVPLDCWMASRKSAAVNSSHFTESLDCAFVKDVTIRDRTRQQNVARFIGFPPTPPCILILFHAFEARHFRLNFERGRLGISDFAMNADCQIRDCQMIFDLQEKMRKSASSEMMEAEETTRKADEIRLERRRARRRTAMLSQEPEKTFLQAVIQVAAAFHHLQRGNPEGARSLLRRVLRRLEAYPAHFGGIGVAAFREEVLGWLETLEAGRATAERTFPEIRLEE